jgi:hypothetical protein
MSEDTISTAQAPDTSIDAATNAFATILAPKEDNQAEGEAQQAAGDSPAVEAESEDVQADEGEAPEAESEEDADPEDGEESDEGEEKEQPVYTIKVDGEEVQVTLDELQKGYSRTQDYTRKTQKLAEMRKQAEVEFEAVRAERQQYSQVLEQLRQQAVQGVQDQPDWEGLRRTDPIEFAAQWAEHQQRQQKLQAIQAEQARLAEIQQREQVQKVTELVAQERQILEEVIPEWRDKEVAKREKGELVEFGRKLGFQTEELANITDHRAVVALRKAYLYDKLMANRAQVKPKPKAPPAPTLKPGSSTAVPKKASELSQAKQRLAKTGAVQDAAAAFESLLLGKGR